MGDEMLRTGAEGAEGAQAASAEDQAGAQGNQGAEDQGHQEKKYTDADVDRIVARKIAAERNKSQKLLEKEQQESEIERRERDVQRREMTVEAKEKLAGEGLPGSLAEIMNYSSKEEFSQSYEKVTAVFREALRGERQNKLSGRTPVNPDNGFSDRSIADAFAPPAR